jgi:hypothetical protein
MTNTGYVDCRRKAELSNPVYVLNKGNCDANFENKNECKPGTVLQTYNPSAWEVEVGGLWTWTTEEDPISKKKRM